MRVTRFDVNGMRYPIGIDDLNPTFHFTVEAGKKEKISEYQLIVSEADRVVFDTGKTLYTSENYIRYAGEKLKPKSCYCANITIWGENDNKLCQAQTEFETGFLGTNWLAKWIEPVQEAAVEEKELEFLEMLIPSPLFWGGEARLKEVKVLRKSFEAGKDIKKARIYATAHGVYNLYVNGRKVSQRRLAPEISEYSKLLYYQTYDVSQFLIEGKNELEITLADGWWIGRLGLAGDSCNFGDKLGFLMQLEMQYVNAKTDIIISDESFECSGSKIRYSDLSIGEKVDNTYKAVAWERCDVTEYDMSNLVGQMIDPLCVTEEIEAKRIFRTPKKELVIDFGQVLAGVCRFEIDAKANQECSFEHGEVLDKDGNYVNNIIGRNKDQKDVLICCEGKQTFEPQFTYHGFRYVRVNGLEESQLLSARALVIGTPIEETGYFDCSDERINKLQHNIKWSERSNMFSIPTDCPQREKLGWTGDIQVFTKTGCFNYDLKNFLGTWMKNVRIDQCDDGEIPVVVPNLSKQERCQRKMSNGSNSSAGWGDACVLVPYYLYHEYGDKKILEDNFETMERWLAYIKSNCELKPEGYANFDEAKKERNKYLWTKQYHFGDWLIPSLRGLPDGVAKGTEETADVVGSAFYAITASCFAEICQILGYSKKAKSYEKLVGNIKSAIQDEFVKEDGTINSSQLQGLYVMILKAEAVQGELKKKVVEKLVDLIEENGYCLDTGFSSVSYLLDVLYENGYKDIAYKLLFQEKAPSWLYMVNNGATTIWENWIAVLEDGTTTDSSYNHYAFGCVGDFIYRHIGGIRKAAPGYREVILEPDLECGLSYSKCGLLTPYGRISIDWKKENGGYEVSAYIPAGVTAKLKVFDKEVMLSQGNNFYSNLA